MEIFVRVPFGLNTCRIFRFGSDCGSMGIILERLERPGTVYVSMEFFRLVRFCFWVESRVNIKWQYQFRIGLCVEGNYYVKLGSVIVSYVIFFPGSVQVAV